MMSAVFGTRCPTSDDRMLSEFTYYIDKWNRFAAPGVTPPIDILPILKYIPSFLPWGTWKYAAEELRLLQRGQYVKLLERSKARTKEVGKNGCFIEDVIEMQEKYSLTDEMVVYVLSSASPSTLRSPISSKVI